MSKSISDEKKLYLAFFIFSLMLSTSIILIEKIFFADSTLKVTLNNAVKKTVERENTFQLFLDQSADVLKTIRNSKYFSKLLEDQTNCQEIEESLFYNFISANNEIMKIRFISKDGFEKIKINRNTPEDKPRIAREKELQNKSNRYYFEKSKTKPLEEVWYSAVDLSVEKQEVEIPFKPTLRAILPVSKSGNFEGIIIINYFMKNFIKKLTHTPLYDMVVFDDRGYIIYHFDEQKSWSFYKVNPFTIKEEFPEHFDTLLHTPLLQTDSFVARKLNLSIDGGIHILLKLNASYKLEETKRAAQKYIITALLVFLFSMALTLIIVKFFGNTLLNFHKIKKLNDELKSSELTKALALRTSQIGIWEWDFHSSKLHWDEQMYRIYGIEKKEQENLLGLWGSVLFEDHKNKIEENFKKAIETRDEHNVAYWIHTPDGKKKYIRALSATLYDEDGKAVKMVGTNQDITNLILTEQKYKSILENAADGVFILDLKGNLIDFSKKAQEMLGYTHDEMKKLTLFDWDPSVSVEQNNGLLETLKRESFSIETKHKRKDGTFYDAFVTANRFFLDNGEDIVYCTVRDISKEKELSFKI